MWVFHRNGEFHPFTCIYCEIWDDRSWFCAWDTLIHCVLHHRQICMELMLEYASMFQDKFQMQGSLPSSVTLSQFFACFLLPWVLSLRGSTVRITFYKSRTNIFTYGLITLLVFGATALATASLLYVSTYDLQSWLNLRYFCYWNMICWIRYRTLWKLYSKVQS